MQRKTPRRVRRPADEARAVILDAAEKRLLDAGPSALRLQDVAADAGISHPLILHHFGSRDGLLQAVVERGVERLQADVLASFQTGGDIPDGARMLDRVHEMLTTKGHGRLVAWLALSGWEEQLDTKQARADWKAITDATHTLRTAVKGGAVAYDDTQFTVMLSWLAMLGLAIAGRYSFRVAGLKKADEPRFRAWLAEALVALMQR